MKTTKQTTCGVTCPYCNSPAALVTGKEVYPHRADLHHKNFYQCKPCGAYVGCYPGSTKAMGRLANKELRSAKMLAHSAFDPIWRGGNKSRSKAYAWLAEKMNIMPEHCHIGMFDTATCLSVVKLCERYYGE